jgi:hypothetical protein
MSSDRVHQNATQWDTWIRIEQGESPRSTNTLLAHHTEACRMTLPCSAISILSMC